MVYYAVLEIFPDAQLGIVRGRETKKFEHSDAEPITPFAKACELFTRERIIDIYAEDEA